MVQNLEPLVLHQNLGITLRKTKVQCKVFYLAPFARYQNFSLSEGNNKGTLSAIVGGLLIGNQWMFKGGVNLDLFIGPSYTTGKIKVTDGVDNFDVPFGIDGFGVRAGLTIGIAF